MVDYFPTKLARGNAFCNRELELKRIKHDIETVNPVLIISPRRYGKTSLGFRAFEQLKLPYVHVDLYKAFSEGRSERFILNGIGQLLGKLEKTPKKLIKLAGEFFASLQIKVSIETGGLKLDFTKPESRSTENILKGLEKLHELAKKRRKKVILYLDEFQVVGEVCKNYAIEAAIREAAQKSEYIVFVFSGSDRHLIGELFNDKKRPFYNLCDMIVLDRISEAAYRPYLQKASVKKWGSKLSEETIQEIFRCTERHTYYMNKLCSLLWLNKLPTAKIVLETWNGFVAESKSAVERELSLLALNQRKIMSIIATKGRILEPFGNQFLTELNVSNSSVSRAMKVLIEKDYLRIDPETQEYSVLDPLIKSVLA